jgi:starvation-inducible DNA-binding protein
MQMHLDTMEGAPSKQQLAQALAVLLSDTVTFKFLAHGYHWNVRGKDFPQFHDKFAEIYEEADGALDPLAENIRKLGFDAPFLLTDCAMLTSIEPIPVSADPIDMSAALYKANAQIIACVRDTFVIANALNEQGIANFLAERDDVHNKWAWQLGTIICRSIARCDRAACRRDSCLRFILRQQLVPSKENRIF